MVGEINSSKYNIPIRCTIFYREKVNVTHERERKLLWSSMRVCAVEWHSATLQQRLAYCFHKAHNALLQKLKVKNTPRKKYLSSCRKGNKIMHIRMVQKAVFFLLACALPLISTRLCVPACFPPLLHHTRRPYVHSRQQTPSVSIETLPSVFGVPQTKGNVSQASHVMPFAMFAHRFCRHDLEWCVFALKKRIIFFNVSLPFLWRELFCGTKRGDAQRLIPHHPTSSRGGRKLR